MAEFRTIHSRMWRDPWFSELDVEGKLLWAYLITNSEASLTGIYHLSPKFVAFETGMSIDRITTLLAQFVIAGKIEWENDVVWVKRMRRYQAQNEASPKIKARIKKDLADIPDGKIKRLYLRAYPIDTVSISDHTETDTDTEQETETDTDTPSADSSRQPTDERSQSENRARTDPERSQYGRSNETKKARAMFCALSDLCAIDRKLISEKQRGALNHVEKLMRENGVMPESLGTTVDDADTFAQWWYTNDWRGKKQKDGAAGRPPSPEEVRNSWGAYSLWLKTKRGNGNGNGTHAKETAQQRAARAERLGVA